MEPRLTGNYQQLTTTTPLPLPMDSSIFSTMLPLLTRLSRLFPLRNLFLFLSTPSNPPSSNVQLSNNFHASCFNVGTIFRLNCNSWNSWHLKGVSNEQTFFSHYRKLFGYLWKTRDISPPIPPLGRCFNFFPDTRTELSTAPFPWRLSAASNVSPYNF